MDPFEAFGIKPSELGIAGRSAIAAPAQARPVDSPLQRMAGAALMLLPGVSRGMATLKLLDAGAVAPGTLDEARGRGLF